MSYVALDKTRDVACYVSTKAVLARSRLRDALGFVVEGFDLVAVLLLDDAALELERGGELAGRDGELVGDDEGALEGFELRQVAVQVRDNAFIERLDARVGDQFR